MKNASQHSLESGNGRLDCWTRLSWAICFLTLPVFVTYAQTSTSQSSYFYTIENLDTAEVVRRGITTSNGIPRNELILAPNTNYREWLYEAGSGRIGSTVFRTPQSGQRSTIPSIPLGLALTQDFDGDGLSDDAEFVVGTDATRTDTDRDGIPDGAELAQGLDPLDGLAVRTGVVGSTETPGSAIDVCAFNDIVIVADADRGISVFNVFNRMVPLIIAQVDTPGNARAVSCSGNLIGVADDSQGLAVVDISDPPTARITQQINLGGSAVAIATAGGIAYAGLGSAAVIAVDMASGTILDRLNLGGSLQDLAIGGETLYVLTVGRLYAVAINEEAMRVSGSVEASGSVGAGQRRWRLFVAGTIAYGTHTSGYNIFSLANPLSPALIRQNNTAQAGWKQIVANGSGIGLAALSPNSTDDGPHDISMYGLGIDGTESQFITTFETPGLAAAVSIYNGLAYAADSSSGLQVINYLAYDSSNRPPAITLTTAFPRSSPTNGVAEEGKTVRVTANVIDDVQVRNVEFYVDGQKVATDGNYPFEHRLVTPLLARQRSFRLQARASDTGGNFAWSEAVNVALVPDATPPRVARTFPTAGAIVGSVDTVIAHFSEPIAPATVNANTFSVTFAGIDGVIGNGDDNPVPGGVVSYRDELNAAFLNFGTNLNPGLYQATVSRPIADLAGNLLGRDFNWVFWVLGASDRDNDGIPDEIEGAFGYDPDNPDTNGNQILDGDEDIDGDSLRNRWELLFGYDPRARDSDANGRNDGQEDPDFDGLMNLVEAGRGLSPINSDSDGDGWDDATEILDGTNPLDGNSGPQIRVTFSSRLSYLNAVPDQPPSNTVWMASSRQVSFLNAGYEEPPTNTRWIVNSPAVSFLNASLDSPPTNTQWSVAARVVSYLNATFERPPTNVLWSVNSVSVAYLNAVMETPSGPGFWLLSPIISYSNAEPAQPILLNQR